MAAVVSHDVTYVAPAMSYRFLQRAHQFAMTRAARISSVRVFRLFSRPLAVAPRSPTPPGFHIELLDERESLVLAKTPELELTEEKIRSAYKRGDVCLAAFDKRNPVAHCWLAFNPLPHLDGVWVDFAKEAAWT